MDQTSVRVRVPHLLNISVGLSLVSSNDTITIKIDKKIFHYICKSQLIVGLCSLCSHMYFLAVLDFISSVHIIHKSF